MKRVEKSIAFSGNTTTFHQINDIVNMNQPTSKKIIIKLIIIERAKLRDKAKKDKKFDAADQLIAEFNIKNPTLMGIESRGDPLNN